MFVKRIYFEAKVAIIVLSLNIKTAKWFFTWVKELKQEFKTDYKINCKLSLMPNFSISGLFQ